MARFFPSCQQLLAARASFAAGHYNEVERLVAADDLSWPHTDDLATVIDEFAAVVEELDLSDEDDGFMVLVPVRVNGTVLTTPVLVDLQRRELLFTSHPSYGAGTIPPSVIAENTELASAVRERMLNVIATWRNSESERRTILGA